MYILDKISFAYPAQPLLFRELSHDFDADVNILIRGENGCGKSTLLKLLVGELSLASGKILSKSDKRCFYVPQDAESRILGLTLEQDLRLWQIAGLKLELTDLARLPLLQGFDPQLFQLPLRELSTGTKQAYVLSLALWHRQHFLVLDEPLPSLDEQRRAIFCKELSQHKGILAVSHEDFPTDPIFDSTLLLGKGKLR